MSHFVWNHQYFEKIAKNKHFQMPPQNFTRVMYIAPSSGHIFLKLNMPFKLILRRFEVVFWCLEWECCTFWKIDGNSFKSTNTILFVYKGQSIDYHSGILAHTLFTSKLYECSSTFSLISKKILIIDMYIWNNNTTEMFIVSSWNIFDIFNFSNLSFVSVQTISTKNFHSWQHCSVWIPSLIHKFIRTKC